MCVECVTYVYMYNVYQKYILHIVTHTNMWNDAVMSWFMVSQEQLTRAAAGSGGGGGGEMGGARGHGPPRVMPVSVPVAQSPGSTTAQLQQV